MGVFLGTYNGYDLGQEDDGRVYACFAANNPFGLTTCCSFKTESIAHNYIDDFFGARKQKHLTTLAVLTDSEFPTVVELIKAGLGEMTFDMIDGLVAEGSQLIH
mgnify:CR=1 FL=1|jgi:hypothetical protein|tara:strand:- start:236 stop:547 length:312 start_codon:yes stop_codon:yes gene_type:complete